MRDIVVVIKVDVDTDRGTRVGVPNLLALFDEFGIKATFLFALGPDNTGRALRRVFRPGFVGKVMRTNVVGTYGLRTLTNGLLWPGPHIGRRNASVMRAAHGRGHEVGIHCYDHVRWQDRLATMSREQVFAEFGRARREFERIFGEPALTAGAAGWQANAHSLAAYDEAGLRCASDSRGTQPFFPRCAGVTYRTLQIPTTMPTLDELLGRSDYPQARLVSYYLSLLQRSRTNVLTIHAEMEGMAKILLFRELLAQMRELAVRFLRLGDVADLLLRAPDAIPVCELVARAVDGRHGLLAVQRTGQLGA